MSEEERRYRARITADAAQIAAWVERFHRDGYLFLPEVLPPGWVGEMSRPSRVSAETGLQLRRLRLEGEDVVGGTDGEGSGFWVVAARDLVIVDVAGNGEQPQDELAALLVRALISR